MHLYSWYSKQAEILYGHGDTLEFIPTDIENRLATNEDFGKSFPPITNQIVVQG